MKTVVFDIEANGLLDKITKIWVIAGIDYNTKERKVFTSEVCEEVIPDGSLADGVRWLMSYDRIIAHNISGYDYHALEKFFPNIWNRETVPFSKMWDTFIQSKCQWFERPRIKGVKGNHGLEYYGELFNYPKPSIEDWSYWDEAKLNRVLVDIEINMRAYEYLNNEASKIGLDFSNQIRRTQATSYWYTKQELYGTKGDLKHMKACVEELDGFIEELRQDIEPMLPPQLKIKGAKCTWEELRDKWDDFYRKVPRTRFDENGKPVKNAYLPVTKVFLKSGQYDKHTADHFGIQRDPDASNRLIVGPYTKIYFEQAKMSQHAVIKDYLLSIGWKPTQFNYEKTKEGSLARDEKGNLIKKSPKLTEDSFESIQGDLGQKIAKYNTYVHRRRTFENEKDDTKGWINQLDHRGRIASGCMAWATETGRGAQRGIVNVPSNHALYGKQMRQSWVADEGKILVSVDQDSAQIRLLANYMGDPDYTEAVLSGTEFDEDHNYVGTDPHTLNAIAFGIMEESRVIEARETQNEKLIEEISGIRKYGKNGFYCVPMDTQALTREGWKEYDEIVEGEEVLGYDPGDGTKKWTKVVKKEKFSDAPVYEFGHSSLKLRATADHRWFVKQLRHSTNGNLRRSIADAHSQVRTTRELNPESNIVMNAPMHPDEDTVSRRKDELKHDKYGTDWVKEVLNMSQDQRLSFLEGFLIADGYYQTDRGAWCWSQNEGNHFEAALVASYLCTSGVIQVNKRKPEGIRGNRVNTVKITKKSHRGLTTARFKELEKQDVWCIQTELGSWVMRQGDTITITGNCYLFGGGDEKLATTLKMKSAKEGKRAKESFAEKLQGVARLQERLKDQFKHNKWGRGGYIEVAGGTWLYCNSEHKLLNYLLMGSEAQLQQQAICWLNHQMRKLKMQGNQILSVHDELTCEVPLEEEQMCIRLMSEMYGIASKSLGLDVLVTGTAQSGHTWSDIH